MAPVTDTGTADDRGGKSPARASAGRWPRDDRESPGCRVAEVDASKSRRAPPTGSSPQQPNRALPESATPRRPTPLGSATAGHPSSDRSRRLGAGAGAGGGCRQQSGARPKYGTGRWVNWQAGKQVQGVLTSAYLAAHSKLKAAYARLSRGSPKRPLGRINPQTTKGAPRACGGGPDHQKYRFRGVECSPRVRGWSRRRPERQGRPGVLPARAGALPYAAGPELDTVLAARGDGPFSSGMSRGRRARPAGRNHLGRGTPASARPECRAEASAAVSGRICCRGTRSG